MNYIDASTVQFRPTSQAFSPFRVMAKHGPFVVVVLAVVCIKVLQCATRIPEIFYELPGNSYIRRTALISAMEKFENQMKSNVSSIVGYRSYGRCWLWQLRVHQISMIQCHSMLAFGAHGYGCKGFVWTFLHSITIDINLITFPKACTI